MTVFKKVSKTEFDAFIVAYPRKLERNVNAIFEPPNINYNDFERAPYWPDSVVASYQAFTSYEDDTPCNYQILADLNTPPDIPDRSDKTPLFDRNGVQIKEGDRIRAHWGYSSFAGEMWREHTVLIRNKGTKYETWSFDDCHNHLRGFDFERI